MESVTLIISSAIDDLVSSSGVAEDEAALEDIQRQVRDHIVLLKQLKGSLKSASQEL